MQSHKFAVGQKVRFRPEIGQVANRGEAFVVVRQLPESGGELPYQAGAPSYLPNAVVYDGRRKRVLLVLGEPRPEVWGWDGQRWNKLSD